MTVYWIKFVKLFMIFFNNGGSSSNSTRSAASIFRAEECTKQAKQSLFAVWLFSLPFDPLDGDSIFFQNTGKLLPDYMVSYPGSYHDGNLIYIATMPIAI